MPVKALSLLTEVGSLDGLVALNFWANWCKPCVQMNAIFEQLSNQYANITFFSVEAEEIPDITEHFKVNAVPFFVFLNSGKVFGIVEGAFPSELTRKVKELSEQVPDVVKKPEEEKPAVESQEKLNERLEKLINTSSVMLFMKGTPDAPQCGFSKKIVKILQDNAATFSSFNILSDQTVRDGLKKYSNWPTYPQLYIDGKLVGGLDIVTELSENGDLKDMLPKKEDINTRLQKLVNTSKVMLFMKGSPAQPRCGFSSKMVNLLKATSIEFGSFDILEDQEVRDGLKKFSNWPTYPQLYVNGKLVGGLDIVTELSENGELKDILAQ
eukprot:TRINITY_DN1352_c0_g1_i2.p1 TRINITY_DN1352_c0_g1~~TRINITY_DN1352_c0_g1_i2.p1  ORF type:complete len:325 (-),score=72.08 TRINITY_DN1352_c0_g1_i2:60-1034(-)